ncbi:sulfate adenylyltransferase, partial [Candidatus Poribacteria bacterium]|nr:sulfate adenylyltransferase [Candidatus Poribacteria bacterium]
MINRVVADADRASVVRSAESLPKLTLNTREASDLEMIGIGGFS